MGWLDLALRGIGSASTALNRSARQMARGAVASRGAWAVRNGILGPGDPEPPPGADYYDYRGVLRQKDLRPLEGLPFTLGRAIEPKRGPGNSIGLPLQVLNRHAAIVGASGAGKTTSLIVPWIATALRLQTSVVAVDVSGDLLDQVLEYRAATGPLNARVGSWNFASPNSSLVWNWLEDAQTPDSVTAATEALVGRDNPHDPQPFFAQRDRRVLRAMIEAIQRALPHPTGHDLLTAAQDQSVLRRLASVDQRSSQSLAEAVSLPPSEYGRYMSGVLNALALFDDPNVSAVTGPSSSVNRLHIRDVLATPSLLVVGAPLSGSRTATLASSLILSQIIQVLYGQFGASATPVVLMIDEAARIADRINYEELLSVSRRAGIHVVLALQTVSQLADESIRHAVLDNCSTYIALPSPSRESASYLSARIGKRHQSQLSWSDSPTVGGRQYSKTSNEVDVLGPREIMSPPFGDYCAVVHAMQVSNTPFLVDLSRPDLGGW